MAPSLYQQDLLRLAATARGAVRLERPQGTARADNPLCGDRITLDVTLENGAIQQIGYQVKACLLCQAAASVIGAQAPGMTIEAAQSAVAQARGLLKGELAIDELDWPDLAAFAPVKEVKSRHVCVLLPVQALEEAITAAQNDPQA